MKRPLFTLAYLLITFCSWSQSSIIDLERPISRIDVGYSIDDNLVFTLMLNTNENTKNLQSSTFINFKASVEGQINWSEVEQDPQKKLLTGVFQPSSSSSPFSFIADAKDGSTALVPSPTKRNWKSLEQVKIKFELEGKYFELPYLTIYPPTIIPLGSKTEINISSQAKMIDKNKGKIKIISNDGTPFEITRIDINRRISDVISNTSIRGGDLDPAKFANNGTIEFPIKTDFELDASGIYTINASVKKIGLPEIIEIQPIEVVFIDEIPIRVIDKSPSFIISINDNDTVMDEVRTEGKGNLGIRFATKEYSDKIRVTREHLGGGTFKFLLEGLNQLSENSVSYFYYTNGNADLSQPYLITKNSPILTNFKFNAVKDNNIFLEFNLPQYVNKNLISINIIGKDTDIDVGGNRIIQPDETDKSRFQAVLPNQLISLISADTIIDVKIVIKYNDKPLYALGMALFNQSLLNQKVSELVAETANRPNRRDKNKIKTIVEGIVKIGEAVGNPINDDEVKNAIETLSGDNKEKIKDVMAAIGKWGAVAGKIVLPLLL